MLQHYRVLDLCEGISQFAGYLLTSLGAEVIAGEPPGGVRSRHDGSFVDDEPDPERSLAHWAYNQGKQSVTADLTTADGRQRLLELVASGDKDRAPVRVAGVPQSFLQAAADAAAATLIALREAQRSGLGQHVDISAMESMTHGQPANLSSLSGYGFMAAAIAGFYEITGWPHHVDSELPDSHVTHAAGGAARRPVPRRGQLRGAR